MQIANNVAKNRIPVIIFSLEMKAIDITAKAISRQTYIDTPDRPNLAKSSDMLLTESIASKFSDKELNVIKNATDVVAKIGENITIVECGAEPYSVEKIGQYVQDYIKVYNKYPFIIVDYLQILDAPDKLKSASDKQVADYNLKRLKVLSDFFNLPIIIISSFNRENYDTEVSFKSFKDSGNIEYSCDTVIGLQLKDVGTKGFNAEAAKSASPRNLELRLLKQRYGKTGEKIDFKFYAKYNYFEEQMLSPNEVKAKILNEIKNNDDILRY